MPAGRLLALGHCSITAWYLFICPVHLTVAFLRPAVAPGGPPGKLLLAHYFQHCLSSKSCSAHLSLCSVSPTPCGAWWLAWRASCSAPWAATPTSPPPAPRALRRTGEGCRRMGLCRNTGNGPQHPLSTGGYFHKPRVVLFRCLQGRHRCLCAAGGGLQALASVRTHRPAARAAAVRLASVPSLHVLLVAWHRAAASAQFLGWVACCSACSSSRGCHVVRARVCLLALSRCPTSGGRHVLVCKDEGAGWAAWVPQHALLNCTAKLRYNYIQVQLPRLH